MYCERLAEIQGAQNRKKLAIWAPSHNFVGLYLRKFANEARGSNWKKTC